MDIVTIDFETYYSKEYSLRNLTTEAYIRDPRFEVIGVCVKINDHPIDWYSGSDPGAFLNSMSYKDKAILCHNTAFDGAILAWKYGIKPKLWLDTMSMARPHHAKTCGVSLAALASEYGLPEKGTEVIAGLGKRRLDFTNEELARYSDYCARDTEITYKLFKKLAKKTPASEIKAIDQTIRMFTEPSFDLDVDVLTAHLKSIQAKKQKLLDALTGGKISEEELTKRLMSNEMFASLLTRLGVEPPRKISKTTGKETWAFSKTDKEFLALQEHPHKGVQALVSARLGVKSTLEETRTQSFLSIAERGRLPILLNYWGAHTGRYSGGDRMNLQNLPRGGALRRALRAPPGKLVATCDSAQIEARLVAWVSGQEDLVQAFREGRDVYSEFATEIYGKPISKKDKIERFVGKTCILGLGYGMGPARLQQALALGAGGIKVQLEDGEVKRIVSIYRSKNHKIESFWRRCDHALKAMAVGDSGDIIDGLVSYVGHNITLPNNTPLKYPGLEMTTDGLVFMDRKSPVKIYGGKLTENIVQALARAVIAEQMTKVGAKYHVPLQVHDEIVVIIPEDQEDVARGFVTDIMSTPPAWVSDLPLSCEFGVGKSYGDAK